MALTHIYVYLLYGTFDSALRWFAEGRSEDSFHTTGEYADQITTHCCC